MRTLEFKAIGIREAIDIRRGHRIASAAAAAKRCAPEGSDILVRTHKKKNTNIRGRGDIDFLNLNLRPHKFCCCFAI